MMHCISNFQGRKIFRNASQQKTNISLQIDGLVSTYTQVKSR